MNKFVIDKMASSEQTLTHFEMSSNPNFKSNTNSSTSMAFNSTSIADVNLVLHYVAGSSIFEKRTIGLSPNIQCDIGRSIMGVREPTKTNAIFNCRVLSRNHAAVWCDDDGKLWFQDRKSSNGSFINGIKLGDKAVELHSGDIIQLGSNVLTTTERGFFKCVIARIGLPQIVPITLCDSVPIMFNKIQIQKFINSLEMELKKVEKEIFQSPLKNEVLKLIDEQIACHQSAKEALCTADAERCQALRKLKQIESKLESSMSECDSLLKKISSTEKGHQAVRERLRLQMLIYEECCIEKAKEHYEFEQDAKFKIEKLNQQIKEREEEYNILSDKFDELIKETEKEKEEKEEEQQRIKLTKQRLAAAAVAVDATANVDTVKIDQKSNPANKHSSDFNSNIIKSNENLKREMFDLSEGKDFVDIETKAICLDANKILNMTKKGTTTKQFCDCDESDENSSVVGVNEMIENEGELKRKQQQQQAVPSPRQPGLRPGTDPGEILAKDCQPPSWMQDTAPQRLQQQQQAVTAENKTNCLLKMAIELINEICEDVFINHLPKSKAATLKIMTKSSKNDALDSEAKNVVRYIVGKIVMMPEQPQLQPQQQQQEKQIKAMKKKADNCLGTIINSSSMPSLISCDFCMLEEQKQKLETAADHNKKYNFQTKTTSTTNITKIFNNISSLKNQLTGVDFKAESARERERREQRITEELCGGGGATTECTEKEKKHLEKVVVVDKKIVIVQENFRNLTAMPYFITFITIAYGIIAYLFITYF